jgi:putative DNA primase/helicase
MAIDDLLSRLNGVRKTGRGWSARCPAHDDRRPSLSIRESNGRILVYCFAACSLRNVCEALGIQVKDLFEDSAPPPVRRAPRPQPVPFNDLAGQLKLHADLLWLRAQDVFLAAQNLDTSSWSDEDWDAATDAIASAYADLKRSDLLADVAYNVRGRWLATRDKRTKV